MDWQFDLCGDHLALNFANTVSERESAAPIERLRDYVDLVAFAQQSGLVDRHRVAELHALAAADPTSAATAHARAVALRDGLYELFVAVARGVEPAAADLAALNGQLGRLRLQADLTLGWQDAPDELSGFVGAIVHAALTLVTDPVRRTRVRVCEARDCEWLFYDGSRNRSRRWCDMQQCGNREKARRHYARHGRGDRAGAETDQNV